MRSSNPRSSTPDGTSGVPTAPRRMASWRRSSSRTASGRTSRGTALRRMPSQKGSWRYRGPMAPPLSRDAYERLQAELADLTTRGRVEMANAIEAARALGDLSENADYHAAKDAQGKMEARIRRVQHMLDTAVIVEGPVAGGEGVHRPVRRRHQVSPARVSIQASRPTHTPATPRRWSLRTAAAGGRKARKAASIVYCRKRKSEAPISTPSITNATAAAGCTSAATS